MSSLINQCETEGCQNTRNMFGNGGSRFCLSCINDRKKKGDLVMYSYYDQRKNDTMIVDKEDLKQFWDIYSDE